jgi:uncharacterized short protein YbdD (DUF466 family)
MPRSSTVTAASRLEEPEGAGAQGTRAPTLLDRLASIARAVNGMFGVPDYDRYVREFSARYPDQTPLTREEFEQDRLHNRYVKPGNRCL